MNGLFTVLQALAQAEGGQQPAGGDPMSGCLSSLPFLVIIVAIFYFLVIRPQKKQQAEQSRFLDRLKEGDRVITTSGIFGRIINLEPDTVTLDVGDRTRIKFLRNQISRLQTEPDSKGQSVDASSKNGSSRRSDDGDDSETGGSKRKRKGGSTSRFGLKPKDLDE